ncbi:MAG: hypothetical protein P8X63_01560 [Desulfuromonadaceae bacterium]
MNFTETGAKTLSELYPNVSRLILFVAFEKADSDAEPNYQQIIFTPDSEAAFRLDCSRDECVDGGFDYAPFIDQLVQSGKDRDHGKMVCQGRLCCGEGETPCSLQSEYRIFIQGA